MPNERCRPADAERRRFALRRNETTPRQLFGESVQDLARAPQSDDVAIGWVTPVR